MPTPRGYRAAPQHEVIDVDLDDRPDQSFAEGNVKPSMVHLDTVGAEGGRHRRQLRVSIIAICVLFVLGVCLIGMGAARLHTDDPVSIFTFIMVVSDRGLLCR